MRGSKKLKKGVLPLLAKAGVSTDEFMLSLNSGTHLQLVLRALNWLTGVKNGAKRFRVHSEFKAYTADLCVKMGWAGRSGSFYTRSFRENWPYNEK